MTPQVCLLLLLLGIGTLAQCDSPTNTCPCDNLDCSSGFTSTGTENCFEDFQGEIYINTVDVGNNQCYCETERCLGVLDTCDTIVCTPQGCDDGEPIPCEVNGCQFGSCNSQGDCIPVNLPAVQQCEFQTVCANPGELIEYTAVPNGAQCDCVSETIFCGSQPGTDFCNIGICENNQCTLRTTECPETDACAIGTCDPQLSGCIYEETPSAEQCRTGTCNSTVLTSPGIPEAVGEECQCSQSSTVDCAVEAGFCFVGGCLEGDGPVNPSQCIVFGPRDCDDGNSCTDDSCNEQLASCVNEIPPERQAELELACQPACQGNLAVVGTPDGSGPVCECAFEVIQNCTALDNLCFTHTCSNGECIPEPVVCDDGNGCTLDSCNLEVGCLFIPRECPVSNQTCEVQTCNSLSSSEFECIDDRMVPDCVRSYGYWKNKLYKYIGGSGFTLSIGDMDLSQLLNAPTKRGNAWSILAHFYAAARLNVRFLDNAPAGLCALLEEVREFLEATKYAIYPRDPNRPQALVYAEQLENYTLGLEGSEACSPDSWSAADQRVDHAESSLLEKLKAYQPSASDAFYTTDPDTGLPTQTLNSLGASLIVGVCGAGFALFMAGAVFYRKRLAPEAPTDEEVLALVRTD